MEFDVLNQLINTMGFPIVMVLYFIYDRKRADEKFTSAIQNISDALNNNTRVIEKLLVKTGVNSNVENVNTMFD